jgi:hypothetical protein
MQKRYNSFGQLLKYLAVGREAQNRLRQLEVNYRLLLLLAALDSLTDNQRPLIQVYVALICNINIV